MNYQVVIVAAGSGRRMGAAENKVLLRLKGKPVICRTVHVFEADPECERIVLVVKKSEQSLFRQLMEQEHLHTPLLFADGGRERQDSVLNGLQQINDSDRESIVLIHDGARPFLRVTEIAALTRAAAESGAAILAVPVKDTIKEVSEGQVKRTLKRESLRAVQTPQAFRLSLIVQAHHQAIGSGIVVTDDASLLEAAGYPVRVITGRYENIKLTTPDDMRIAEKFVEEEGEER
ncbi:MAG: 2-C-methyl-D-erythritol 4-phosphate cytidylyltransferase [Sporolactobacillus sp.]